MGFLKKWLGPRKPDGPNPSTERDQDLIEVPRAAADPLQEAIGLHSLYLDAPSSITVPDLEQAIILYETALQKIDVERFPFAWAKVQVNRGDAYAELSGDHVTSGHRGFALAVAVSCYEEALSVFTEDRFPRDWAAAQVSLATACSRPPFRHQSGNLDKSVACYTAALRICTEANFPNEWATIQNDLGVAYSRLPTGDRAANLERAIGCYVAALRVRTEHALPTEWATTINNLGNAYAELPGGDRVCHLQQAISCYEAALRVYNEEDFPLKWAWTQENLGVAYDEYTVGDRLANLKCAIACYTGALKYYPESESPLHFAGLQNLLGRAYLRLSSEKHEPHLEKSIECFIAALRPYTMRNKRDFSTDWASIKVNLGIAYASLGSGDEARNRAAAISAFEDALTIYNEQQFPREFREAMNRLADVHYRNRSWQEASDASARAISATENIRSSALDSASRRRTMRESRAIFERAALAAIHNADFALALKLTERGKTRELADQLYLRDVRPQRVSTNAWAAYQAALKSILAIEGIGGQPPHDVSARSSESLDGLIALRNKVRSMESEFSAADPDYVPFARPLEIDGLAEVTQTVGVLVEFSITSEGTYVFFLGPNERDVVSDQIIQLPELTTEYLGVWLREWFRAYYARDGSWPSYVQTTCRKLYRDLMSVVHGRLRQRYPSESRLVLIPSQVLNVLPLHAASWSDDGKTHYLLDEYEIVYSPSCEVLKRCLSRELQQPGPARTLFAVQNPDGTLPFADWEVGAITRWFDESECRVFRGEQAQEAVVKSNLAFGAEKLFSTHCTFDLDDVDQSSLRLADGSLRLREVVQARMHGTWLTVLSACESALSELGDIADEYQGLPAAFLLAGSHTVIASLWPVQDASTALLMQRFHENLYRVHLGKAAALREAQSWLRNLDRRQVAEALVSAVGENLGTGADLAKALAEGPERPFASPHSWAAFQCIGAR